MAPSEDTECLFTWFARGEVKASQDFVSEAARDTAVAAAKPNCIVGRFEHFIISLLPIQLVIEWLPITVELRWLLAELMVQYLSLQLMDGPQWTVTKLLEVRTN
jgi:hypothetical protein